MASTQPRLLGPNDGVFFAASLPGCDRYIKKKGKKRRKKKEKKEEVGYARRHCWVNLLAELVLFQGVFVVLVFFEGWVGGTTTR